MAVIIGLHVVTVCGSSPPQVWVYGNSFKSSLVAVVVPKEDKLKVGGI
jgi:hypothetical protein